MSAAVTQAPRLGRAKTIAVDVVLNVVLPYVVYALMHNAGQKEARALLVSAVVPAVVAVASIVYRRRMNGLSLLVVFGTGLSLAASALSGSAWFDLIRPSFITGSIAVVFLASLAAQRPTLFYLARDTMCATAEAAAEFEGKWVHPVFRRTMRRLTLVWAAFLGGEALLRGVLAAIWPNANLIAATQILWIVLPILLVRWSIRAGTRWAVQAGMVPD
jgi:hypothetical protein